MRCRALLLVLILNSRALLAQSASNVLVVINEASPASLEVGQYYVEKRGVPRDQVLRVRVKAEDEISRSEYEHEIESPLAGWLARNSTQDRILYIVLTKGVPLRISGTGGPDGTVASVDSELTLLYRKMTGVPVLLGGHVENPHFLGESGLERAKGFTHKDHDIFLVSRLDGYSPEDVRALIDRGYAPLHEGKILLDQRQSTPDDKGNAWLRAAAERLRAGGFGDRVVLESTESVLRDQKDVLGYYSWGSNDPAIRTRSFGFSFVPGALAAMFVSSDGRTFREPPADWTVGPWDRESAMYAGSPQSLAGDLIRAGITGIAAHVAEPFLEGAVRPDILFPAYLSGFTLIESFYLAMPYLSWRTIVVGDPLCAPFRIEGLSGDEIDPGIDQETELPEWFSQRRTRTLAVQAYRRTGVPPDAIKALLRAEVRLAKNDLDGARRALESATAKDNRLVSAQSYLAAVYERSGEYEKAIERYRKILELSPDNAVILNELAYSLAVRQGKTEEALILAERAYGLAKGNANIADTLGWVLYLAGNSEKAYPYLDEAQVGAPGNAEIQLHFAFVCAVLGRMPQAESALTRALQLDSTLESRPEVLQLREKLKK